MGDNTRVRRVVVGTSEIGKHLRAEGDLPRNGALVDTNDVDHERLGG